MIKVKDYKNIYGIFIGMGLFPILFMLVSVALDFNFLLAFFIVLGLYSVALYFYYRLIKKRENEYAIVADEKTITIRKAGTYSWDKISDFETFLQYNGRSMSKYLKIKFTNGTELEMNANSFDMDYKDLEKELRYFKEIKSKQLFNE